MVYDTVYNECMNDKFESAFKVQLGPKYLTQKELQYDNSSGVFLTPYEYSQYLLYKEQLIDNKDKRIVKLPLKSFNHKYIYFSIGDELHSLVNSYLSLIQDDYSSNKLFISDRLSSNIYKSRIYSEIEGSLNVENVPTTRRRLKELLEEDKTPECLNDIIIKNMDKAIKYVETAPSFNKENLYHLYNLLSEGCLKDDDKLKDGEYYRYDTVEVGGYRGCPHTMIEECMDSLFSFVNEQLKEKKASSMMYLPHVCHYYILYIHPYFDYNGRTARMVSYWIYLLGDKKYHPPIISEAINQTKNNYYHAIELSRDAHNDISYFLLYLFSMSCDYILCYQNLEYIEQQLKNKGEMLTETDSNYLKKIMVTYNGKFTYLDFLNNCKIEMTKQGALKLLNKYVSYGILQEVETPSKSKLFDLDQKMIKYRLKNIKL